MNSSLSIPFSSKSIYKLISSASFFCASDKEEILNKEKPPLSITSLAVVSAKA